MVTAENHLAVIRCSDHTTLNTPKYTTGQLNKKIDTKKTILALLISNAGNNNGKH
jgi:hypothetical protein